MCVLPQSLSTWNRNEERPVAPQLNFGFQVAGPIAQDGETESPFHMSEAQRDALDAKLDDKITRPLGVFEQQTESNYETLKQELTTLKQDMTEVVKRENGQLKQAFGILAGYFLCPGAVPKLKTLFAAGNSSRERESENFALEEQEMEAATRGAGGNTIESCATMQFKRKVHEANTTHTTKEGADRKRRKKIPASVTAAAQGKFVWSKHVNSARACWEEFTQIWREDPNKRQQSPKQLEEAGQKDWRTDPWIMVVGENGEEERKRTTSLKKIWGERSALLSLIFYYSVTLDKGEEESFSLADQMVAEHKTRKGKLSWNKLRKAINQFFKSGGREKRYK